MGLRNILTRQVSYELDMNFMKLFYYKILKLSFISLCENKIGDLIARLNDIKMVRTALSDGLASIISNFITFIVVGIALFLINKILFFLLFVSVVLLGCIAVFFGYFFSKEYPIAMIRYADVQSFVVESFSSIEMIKTKPAIENFKKECENKQRRSVFRNWVIEEKCLLQNFYSSGIEKISSILILSIGCFLVMSEKMSLGEVVGFISLSFFFSSAVKSLLDLQAGIHEALAAMDRLFEILDKEDENMEEGVIPEDFVPNIKFENISFSYKNKPILYEDFSLEILAGEWIAFVGKAGCGKTTISKLLLKLYTPCNGNIFLNTLNLNCINTTWLRSKIAYIPQDFALISGTILDNITLFDENIDFEKVIEVAKLVGIDEKIQTLPEKYNTVIGERGYSLSGGEKQKIAITRALLNDSLIIIVDEATSNLDSESESRVTEILFNLKQKGITIISIAHRLSSVRRCDRIVVLDNGKIAEIGSHDELLKQNGLYSSLLKQ